MAEGIMAGNSRNKAVSGTVFGGAGLSSCKGESQGAENATRYNQISRFGGKFGARIAHSCTGFGTSCAGIVEVRAENVLVFALYLKNQFLTV
jgi:hypothetical protein